MFGCRNFCLEQSWVGSSPGRLAEADANTLKGNGLKYGLKELIPSVEFATVSGALFIFYYIKIHRNILHFEKDLLPMYNFVNILFRVLVIWKR